MADDEIAAAVAVDNSQLSSVNLAPGVGSATMEYSNQQIQDTLQTSALTGKFWHDWDKLRSILSYYLNQVLSQYPEAKMSTDLQTASLGETFPELVKRLNNALHTFVEGPPFTLQRLCEILLSATTIYPKLSKLSLALEKNLLVTSMLTISADPLPLASKENTNGSCEEAQPQTNPLENGVETVAEATVEGDRDVAEATVEGDRDEIMTEVEEAEADEEMITMETETIECVVRSSEANLAPTIES